VAFLLFFRAMNLLALYFLFNASDLLVAGDSLPTQLHPVIKNLNQAIHIGLAVAVIVTVAQAARDVYRYFLRGDGNGQRAIVSL